MVKVTKKVMRKKKKHYLNMKILIVMRMKIRLRMITMKRMNIKKFNCDFLKETSKIKISYNI